MRYANTGPELMELVRRFVTPGRRYLRLGGSSLRLSGPERDLFVRELVQAAGEITPAELGILPAAFAVSRTTGNGRHERAAGERTGRSILWILPAFRRRLARA
ncbi:DUF6000 family protein [Streptomyces sp. NPDC006477]|uniref:DUF6000 family protein n=1 Tax=Streptomyces sp. NPDC006477 TaxID=3364747 RepID=UPI0036743896